MKMGREAEKNLQAFHPGYYIAEIIEDAGVSQGDFAERLGIPESELAELIDGKIRLSDDVAEKLAKLLGTSKEVWMNLQRSCKSV